MALNTNYAFFPQMLNNVVAKHCYLVLNNKTQTMEFVKGSGDTIKPEDPESFPYEFLFDEDIQAYHLIIPTNFIQPTMFLGMDPLIAYICESLSEFRIISEFGQIYLCGYCENSDRRFQCPLEFFETIKIDEMKKFLEFLAEKWKTFDFSQSEDS